MVEPTIPGDNIYYNAEGCGFQVVADEDTAGSYEFDQVLVVRATDGTLWAAHDSGCSCPTPFEDVRWPTDWTAVTRVEDLDSVFEDWSCDDNDKSKVRIKVVEALRAAA
jgi:hypothetical protein